MATCRQPLIAGWLLPGLLAASIILIVTILTLGALWFNASLGSVQTIWQDNYLWQVIRFTFWQAFLSALLSILPAVLLARSLNRRRFYGRQQLLRLCTMTLVLPVLVAVFGLLSVYGRQGWLATLCHWLAIEYNFSPYGLPGILLAHVFFNLPLATRLLLQSLEQIPVEQCQLSAQLGMDPWQHFMIVEWPALQRQLLPTGALIFMLCFASFATVLTLGGGPQATTIELAIFQTLSYDFDPGQAAILAMIQLFCCLGCLLLSQRLSQTIPAGHTLNQTWRNPRDSKLARYGDTLLILLALLLILPPLLAVIINGINHSLLDALQQPALWQAAETSIRISLASGVLSILLSIMLLWSSRELRLRHSLCYGQTLELCGTLILAMPGIVLATGIFLLLNGTIGIPQSADGIIILINALMALPFALKILSYPMLDVAERYTPLIHSLGMTPWQRLRWIEFTALRRPLAQALAFACVLSIGDFGAIALFGHADFRTLPFYLYQQIGAYRSHDAAVTALLLLLLCYLLFTLIEKLPGHHAHPE